MNRVILSAALAFLAPCGAVAADAGPIDLRAWLKHPATFAGAAFAEGKATLTSDKWSFLVSKDERADGELAATITILEPAKHFRFFGESWSAWPEPTWSDGGFEAALLLRAGKDSGYRVQLSHLGAERFYLDGAYYRGLIGRTLVFNRALSPQEIQELRP